MNELTSIDTKEYLKKVLELELAIYKSNRIIEKLSRIKEPILEEQKEDKTALTNPKSHVNTAVFGLVIGIILFILSVFFIGFSEEDWWEIPAGFLFTTGFGAYLLDGIAKDKEYIKNINKEIDNSKKKYEEQKRENENKYKKQVAYYLGIKGTLTIIENANSKLQNTLTRAYNKNIIYDKYRNLIAISTMSEYFETGRCDSLGGPNGAYNLFEQEIRQNIIINNLNDILVKLDTIKNNQYLLYKELVGIGKAVATVNGKKVAEAELTFAIG